jgi:anti-anti-sigma factor
MPIQQWSDKIWVVQLADEPALSEDLNNVHTQATDAEQLPHVVLDLSAVTKVNSSNLAQLLRLRKLAIDGMARLRLAGPTDSVWAVMLTTGLEKVFEFTADVPTALASIQIDT